MDAWHEALKLCMEKGWGEVLDPQEVAVYLGSNDASLRLAAVQALGWMGKAGGSFAKEVATRLEDKSSDVRASAAWALSQMGDQGAAFAKEIAGVLKDRDIDARSRSQRHLGGSGKRETGRSHDGSRTTQRRRNRAGELAETREDGPGRRTSRGRDGRLDIR